MSDTFETDEPVGELVAAFEAGPHVTTGAARFGIPYAFEEEDATSPSGAVKVCPECGERIPVLVRKDFESFTGEEYVAHYREAHEQA